MKAEVLLAVGLIIVCGAVEAVSITRIVVTAVIGLSIMGRGVWLIHNPAYRRIFRR